jgi:ABC-2 type transport system permease protein
MIGATILKDIQLLLRDRGRLLMMFAMPVIFIVVFGSMFKFAPDPGKPKPIAIWHAPDDARGKAIEAKLGATQGFSATPLGSADEVRAAVARETFDAGLVVPESATTPVELVIDLGAPMQRRAPLQSALTGVVMRAMSPVDTDKLPPLVEAKTPPGIKHPYDDVTGFQVTVPGNAVLFGFFIAMAVAISFAHERNTGTWKRLLAAPVPRWKAFVGKLVPYYVIGLCQLAFLFGIGIAVFGMNVAGSPAALVLLTVALELSAVSFGMLVASFGGSERQIGSTVPVFLLVMGLLGGCMFPRLLMPDFMKQIGLAVPHSWALDGYYDILIRKNTTVADVASPIIALCVFSVVFLAIGIWRFRSED